MSLTDEVKDEIYDYLVINKKNFIYKKDDIDKTNRMNEYLLYYNLNFGDLKKCFDFLTSHWDKKCKNKDCDNERKLQGLFPDRKDYIQINKKWGIFKFCDLNSCNYQSISNRQLGENNTSHRMTKETLESMKKKVSSKIKDKISRGEFIPNVTNSWAKSRCDVKIIRHDTEYIIKTRSSWDGYFQILNPEFLYEKIVIPYYHEKNLHNYIVDFLDPINKILFEIKPDATYNIPKNISKYKYAKKWCRKNGYKYKIINNKWFRKNYNPSLVMGQPSEDKLLRNLRQFNENKIYKENRI